MVTSVRVTGRISKSVIVVLSMIGRSSWLSPRDQTGLVLRNITADWGPGSSTGRTGGRRALYFFTANTPSPLNAVANPARRKRLATSPGTSRPLVSLFGVPV